MMFSALCSSLLAAPPRVSRAFADAVLRLPVARSQTLRAGVDVVRSPSAWALAVARVPGRAERRFSPPAALVSAAAVGTARGRRAHRRRCACHRRRPVAPRHDGTRETPFACAPGLYRDAAPAHVHVSQERPATILIAAYSSENCFSGLA